MPDPATWLSGVDDPPHLLVVGGASFDVLHVRGTPTKSLGGSGLYTALAASRAGVRVTMLAPRPDPMPAVLAPVLDHVEWIGPVVPPDRLPRFEIAYDGSGAPTLYDAHMGAENEMTPDLLDMVGDLPQWVFCVPFADPRRQQVWVDALIRAGRSVVSTTYIHAAVDHPSLVRSIAERCRVWVCNEEEAGALWPSGPVAEPGSLVYITRGATGAAVLQGDHRTGLAGVHVDAVDTTGAGDTFTGTVAADLMLGRHPVEAGHNAVAASAHEVTGVGPERLLDGSTRPRPPSDDRAVIDRERITAVAHLLAGIDDLTGSDFAGPTWPPAHHPAALDALFASTLQQWGFWSEDAGQWAGSMVAEIGGSARKGSDYLSAAYTRWLHDDPAALAPDCLATVTRDSFDHRMADDSGANPLPVGDVFHGLAVAYGQTMSTLGWTPESMVTAAAATRTPLASLLRLLDHVGGYREDPLRKKSALLGVIIRQRPEAWLPTIDGDDAPPIVDYHIQRTCLRTGMVVITDEDLARRVTAREIVPAADEDAVRRACYLAVAELAAGSGRDMGTVDWFLFQMRRHCPEASTPDCPACPAQPACARHVDLFQPVFRTTAY